MADGTTRQPMPQVVETAIDPGAATDRGGARLRWGTRFAFILSGYGLGSWSAVVPFAKLKVGANDAQMGVLILCMGLGSILMMPITGVVAGRYGSRPVIIGSGIVVAAVLPLLALAGSQAALAAGLLVLGGALGSLDVAMNAHAVEVEIAADRPLMSGFHACFSIGGFAGAGAATALFSIGATPVLVLGCAALLGLCLVVGAAPRLLRIPAARLTGGGFAWPKGIVILLTVLSASTYLAEGAMFDWGSLLITARHLVPITQGGLAFMLFSTGMTIGRLAGDAVGLRLGRANLVQGGALLGAVGLTLALTAPVASAALLGFLLVGLGTANAVPILFSQAGRQCEMPPGAAIATITTVSYGVTLAGPGLIGFLASAVGLAGAFWLFVLLLLVVAVTSRAALR